MTLEQVARSTHRACVTYPIPRIHIDVFSILQTVFPTRRGGDRSAAMTPASNSRSDVDDATIPGSPGPKLKSERSFFGATLGRNRKPPPRVPSYVPLEPLHQICD
jgi:hypothetical protein